MGSTNAGADALAKAVEERGYSCTANQEALREVCCMLIHLIMEPVHVL